MSDDENSTPLPEEGNASSETILNIPKVSQPAGGPQEAGSEDATTDNPDDDGGSGGGTSIGQCEESIGEFDDGKSGKLTLGTLLQEGIIEQGEGVMAIDYLGQTFKGDLLPIGKIKSQETGLVFNNPSAWAIYCKKIVNPSKKSGCGWASVKYKGKKMDHFKTMWNKMKVQRDAEEAEKKAEEEAKTAELAKEERDALEKEFGAGTRRVYQHYELPEKQSTDDVEDLIETDSFAVSGKVQPFSVSIASSALLIIDLHTHSSVPSVCGYLAGQWDINAHNLAITHAFPCLMKDNDETKATKVEYDIYNTIYGRNLTLVGWYKSCSPNLPKALPSLKDSEAQLDFQVKLLGTSDATYSPCVGLITKPFNLQGCESDNLFYWVVPPPENSPNEYGKPMKMSYSVVTDPCLSQDLLEQIDKVVEFGTNGIRYHENFRGQKTFATKLGESVIPKFPMDQDVRLWQYVRGKILDDKYVDMSDPLSDKMLGNGGVAAHSSGKGGHLNGNSRAEDEEDEEEIDDDEENALIMNRRKSRSGNSASTVSAAQQPASASIFKSQAANDVIARLLQRQSPVGTPPPLPPASRNSTSRSEDGPLDFSSPNK